MDFLTSILDPLSTRPVDIDRTSPSSPLLLRPLLAPLLFPNESSDARDHCANERTFLSWLRLSIYMAVVSVAIVISFHLKSQPTSVERRFSLPVGIVFWLLSMACLASGVANYLKTVRKYARREALVQSGWKTQVVCVPSFSLLFGFCFWGGWKGERGGWDWADSMIGLYDCSVFYCGSLCAAFVDECYVESVTGLEMKIGSLGSEAG